ncbi:MAG: glycosyltransferase 87 family protein [Nitrososphaerota archaeon]
MKRVHLHAFVYSVAVISWLLSAALHNPRMSGNIYSDIVYFWWRDVEIRLGLAPCFQFFFEYPPLSCGVTYLSRILGGPLLESYYSVFVYLSLPAYILLAWSMITIVEKSGAGRIGLLAIASPSLVVYGIYNYDHFATALVAAAIALFLIKKPELSGLASGLAFAFKLYSGLILPLFLMELRDNRQRLSYFVYFLLGAGVPYIAQIVLNPSSIAEFFRYHYGWGLENAWYIWIFGKSDSPSAKIFGLALGAYLVLRVYVTDGSLLSRCFLAVAAWLFSSYIFTPQMVIWLLPLLVAQRSALYLWPALEITNVGIIMTWFGEYDPVMPGTPPQILALLRAVALGLMGLSVYYHEKGESPKKLLFRILSMGHRYV